MPGTEAAPEAMASVRGWNENGGRLSLSISGLPEAPAGSVHQPWWVGVARRDYPRLWVTLEKLDEDESLSGIKVMDTGY